MTIQHFDMKFSLMFALNKYLSAGILFLAVLFVVIDLWSFEDSRDFAKKRLSHYISSIISLSMTRQFLEKRGFQKTPFPISVGLQIFFAIGLDHDMKICKISSL